MAAEIEIVPARSWHIRRVARHMRQADRDEVFAASGRSPREALAFSLRKSILARTVLVNGRPEAIFGVADLNILANVGAPWLLGTDEVVRNFVGFLRGSVEWRDQLLGRYAELRNFVDVRNIASIRWLAWLGFSFSDPVEHRGHVWRVFQLRSVDVRHKHGPDNRRDALGRGGLDQARAGGEGGRSV